MLLFAKRSENCRVLISPPTLALRLTTFFLVCLQLETVDGLLQGNVFMLGHMTLLQFCSRVSKPLDPPSTLEFDSVCEV